MEGAQKVVCRIDKPANGGDVTSLLHAATGHVVVSMLVALVQITSARGTAPFVVDGRTYTRR
jgi:hypothetical protein